MQTRSSHPNKERCLIIFAKEPIKGEVKTRLSFCLSEEERLNLYKAFIKDTLLLAKSIQVDIRFLAIESFARTPQFLISVSDGFSHFEQQGNDLGIRLWHAFHHAHQLNYNKTVIIGSDSPTLPAKLVEEAFRRLNSVDIVLGPTRDGGYYLIGAKLPHAEIFYGIAWSSPTVLKKTVENILGTNKSYHILPEWYDIDTCEDLNRLRKNMPHEENIAIFSRKALSIH